MDFGQAFVTGGGVAVTVADANEDALAALAGVEKRHAGIVEGFDGV